MAMVVLELTFHPPPPPLPPPPPHCFSYHSPARGFPFTFPNGFPKLPKWISLINIFAISEKSSSSLFRIAKSSPPLLSLKKISKEQESSCYWD